MNLVNRIVTRNATLFLYAAAGVGYVVDVWLPTMQFESRWLTLGAMGLTLVVNAVRAGMEKSK